MPAKAGGAAVAKPETVLEASTANSHEARALEFQKQRASRKSGIPAVAYCFLGDSRDNAAASGFASAGSGTELSSRMARASISLP